MDAAVEEAYRFLRSHTRGDLRFDEHLRPIKFVIEPEGRLVASVMVAMLQSPDTVLFIPEATDGALEVMVTLDLFDEDDAASAGGSPGASPGAWADRWRIYHGDPPDVRWALMEIDAARSGEVVVDGPALARGNALADDEPALCRWMNHERKRDLRPLLVRYGEVDVEEPVMVGIDPLGIDVRGRFEVYRVPATEPMPDADAARATLDAMCREGSVASPGGAPDPSPGGAAP